jgi:hypothetical protein
VLSGDAHHYARYAGNGREPQFITSGGGGAYLTGTAGLKPKLTLLNWPGEPQLAFKKCYPTKQESQELLGGVIYGLYLWLTARFFDLNQDNAFSAMRLDGRRHFIRMRIVKDSITVYPVKIDEIPHRDRWKMNTQWGSITNPSVFVPDPPLEPSLIEEPIVIRVGV